MKKLLAGAAFALTIALSTALPTAAMAATGGWTSAAMTIHSGPGKTYPVIGHVAARSSLDVQGCLRDGSWCNVFSHGKYGWVHGKHVMIVSHKRHVTIAQAAEAERPPIIVYDSHSTHPVPVAATGRPPYDRAGGDAADSIHNRIPRMIDDRVYNK